MTKVVRLLILVGAAAALALLFTPYAGGPRPANAAPANDDFANAIPIATPTVSGIVAVGDNVGATTEGSESFLCGGSASVWYAWTSPPSPGVAVLDTWGSDFDTILSVFTGSAFPLTFVECEDDLFPGNLPSGFQFAYAASTTYRIQVAGYNGLSGNVVLNMSLGAAMYVNNTADTNASDGILTLREAMLLARDGTGANGLNRALGADSGLVLNASAAGASGSDLIHFAPNDFPPGTPSTIAIGSDLPYMDVNGDVVSGIGAGVIVDGQNLGNIICFALLGNGNHIEGLQIRRYEHRDCGRRQRHRRQRLLRTAKRHP
jgi:hypothetical protein